MSGNWPLLWAASVLEEIPSVSLFRQLSATVHLRAREVPALQMRWSQAVLRGAEHKDKGLLPLDVPAGCGGKVSLLREWQGPTMVGLSNLRYLFVGFFN